MLDGQRRSSSEKHAELLTVVELKVAEIYRQTSDLLVIWSKDDMQMYDHIIDVN